MPGKRASQSESSAHYWERRLRSPAFKRDLTALFTREIEALARKRVGDVIDAGLVRAVIREWDSNMVNEHIAAELAIIGNRRAAAVLKRQRASVRDLLGPQIAADIDALLQENVHLSARAEARVAKIMQQEFLRQLFTDLIFTAIVAFHKRVNPIFGGLAMRLLEEQIKGFIDLFMPMLQRQATAFAVGAENQRVLLDFVRAVTRLLLDEPAAQYAAMVSVRPRGRAAALIRDTIAEATRNPTLQGLIRDMALAVWQGVYTNIRHKRVGELLRLEQHAGWLAQRAIAALLPLLSQPGVVQFAVAELVRAEAARR